MSRLGPNQRMALVALVVLALDQLTKLAVLNYLGLAQERVVIDGFFKFVHWINTGAAWSMFHDNNALLAIVSLVAFAALVLFRHHFEAHRPVGQFALGLLFGGILGNLVDRLVREHVIDFLYFYVHKRGGGDAGFAAFNVADSAICVGVGLLFCLSWLAGNETPASAVAEAGPEGAPENNPQTPP